MPLADLGGDKTQASQGDADFWIIKLDAAGTKQWDKTIGGSRAEIGGRVWQAGDGGYVVGGISQSGSSGDNTQPSQGSYDYWMLKLDAAGLRQWDKTLGGSNADFLTSIHPTADGGYVVGGQSASPISGDKTQANWGQSDYWVVKLGPTGPTATTPAPAPPAVLPQPRPRLPDPGFG